jgi:hypothetical protein
MGERGRYVIFGLLPVKEEITPSGGSKTLKLNWETLAFEWGYEYDCSLSSDTDGDAEEVTKDEFIEHVESLRAERYKKDDELGAFYKSMNEIEARAKAEDRALTTEEKAELTALRYKTYAMFAELYPEP